jgi:hypothetical protein
VSHVERGKRGSIERGVVDGLDRMDRDGRIRTLKRKCSARRGTRRPGTPIDIGAGGARSPFQSERADARCYDLLDRHSCGDFSRGEEKSVVRHYPYFWARMKDGITSAECSQNIGNTLGSEHMQHLLGS